MRNMDGRYPALPGDIVDRNDEGYLEAEEFEKPFRERPWFCGAFRSSVTSKAHGGQDRVSAAEFFADIRKPDIVYSERMTLLFGGKRIELVFPGQEPRERRHRRTVHRRANTLCGRLPGRRARAADHALSAQRLRAV